MKPIDFSNETFQGLRDRLHGARSRVWTAWIAWEIHHGLAGATTRQVAVASGIDLLTFRPRTTELYQVGAIRLADDQPDPTEARYVVRSEEEMRQWWEEQRAAHLSGQQQLPLSA